MGPDPIGEKTAPGDDGPLLNSNCSQCLSLSPFHQPLPLGPDPIGEKNRPRRRRGRFFSPIGSGPRGSGWWNGDHGKYHKTLVEADVGCGTWDCSFIQIQPVSERPSS